MKYLDKFGLTHLITKIKSATPTKTSELVNDSGYLTNIPSEYITETELDAKKYLTSIPDTYADKTYVDEAISNAGTSIEETDWIELTLAGDVQGTLKAKKYGSMVSIVGSLSHLTPWPTSGSASAILLAEIPNDLLPANYSYYWFVCPFSTYSNTYCKYNFKVTGGKNYLQFAYTNNSTGNENASTRITITYML